MRGIYSPSYRFSSHLEHCIEFISVATITAHRAVIKVWVDRRDLLPACVWLLEPQEEKMNSAGEPLCDKCSVNGSVDCPLRLNLSYFP